ncbi:hypothetical protein [Marinoscillum sp. MHG1-6]|uniref:hypothetical protein n=1 Tax=Marinoscillum sp. MHG1-6 TaxID=2959627 RepID=UPI0021576832|nr:hypothetical protein [Marinoscillum sp. MHG1-6]
MADINQTDLLFRERLSNMEVTPTELAWQQFQQEIVPKKSVKVRTYWAAAASIAILLAVVAFWKTDSVSDQYLSGSIDHPVQRKEQIVVIALPVPDPQKISDSQSDPIYKLATKTAEPETNHIIVEERVPEIFTVEAKPAQQIAIPYSYSLDLAPVPADVSQSVRIAHMPGNKKDGVGESLTKVISVAQQVSPAGLLADLRDAKNQLLSRN